MNELEIRSLAADIIDNENEDLLIRGYIETGVPSKLLSNDKISWKEIIEKGVFGRAIGQAIDRNEDIDLLYNHNKDEILASTVNNSFILEEDEVGLYFEANISKTSWGKDAYTLVKDGIISGLSFGMRVLNSHWVKSVNGTNIRIITEVELSEVSVLKTPAYASTLVETRGFAKIEDVDVPDFIEIRSFGGTNVDNNETEVTPDKFYDGMLLIAEKLDNILIKLDDLDKTRTSKSLEEAKEVLLKTTALVEAQTRQKEVESMQEEVRNEAEATGDIQKESNEADAEDENKEESTTTAAPPSPDSVDNTEDEDTEETKKRKLEEKRSLEEATENTEEVAETADAEEAAGRAIKVEENDLDEYRSLIEKIKSEVPEIE